MGDTTVLAPHIVRVPGIRGGRPHIEGRGFTVARVAFLHREMGMTPGEIANEYNLGLAEVHSALAYFFDHQAEIDHRTAEDEAFVDEMRRNAPPSLLHEKFRGRGG